MSSTQLAIAIAASALSVGLDLARLTFYFRLRVGLLRSPLAPRLLDRVVGSILVRTAFIVVAVHVALLWDHVAEGRVISWMTLGLAVYFGLVSPALHRRLARWSDDADSEFRVSLRALLQRLLGIDRSGWIELEGEIRIAVSRRTKLLRERSNDCLADLWAAASEEVARHVERSRARRWLGYPGYYPGDWYRNMRPADPKRLEILINALGFPEFERRARQHPAWRDASQRHSERVAVRWAAVTHAPQGSYACEITDISAGGLGAALTGADCEGAGIAEGHWTSVEMNGARLALQVVWKRTRSFGGRFATPPGASVPS